MDAVSGATVTSEGVFAAVKAAVEAEAVEEETKAVAVEGALTGTAKGFGGEIQAQVVVDESGVITESASDGRWRDSGNRRNRYGRADQRDSGKRNRRRRGCSIRSDRYLRGCVCCSEGCFGAEMIRIAGEVVFQ